MVDILSGLLFVFSPMIALILSLVVMMLKTNERTKTSKWRWEATQMATYLFDHTLKFVNDYCPRKQRVYKRRKRKRSPRYLAMVTVIQFARHMQVCQAALAYNNVVRFDTDGKPIGVDNRCSVCISDQISDFEGPLKASQRSIKGFNGSRTQNIMTGTIKWSWEDDDGKRHVFTIPKSLYVPNCGVRLLSPQHWAQQQRDKTRGTGEYTDDKECVLYWNNRTYKRTIPLDRDQNVATFNSTPGFKKYMAFCIDNNLLDDPWHSQDLLCHDATMVSDDDDDDISSDGFKDPEGENHYTDEWKDESPFHTTVPRTFDVSQNPSATNVPNIIHDEEERQATTPTAELLQLHYDMGHISFRKLQLMAKKGIVPKRLANCSVPTCSACEYAKATRRPWRGKSQKNHVPNKPTQPGHVVSVDQLVSPTPGLIAQMTGFIMKHQRYRYSTVYVDQYSGFSYTYLQKTASAEETVRGKIAFEKYARANGVTVRHYHADNGIFKAKEWVNACEKQGQGLTFAAVGAHHQNGKAERRIRELQETARAMLLHAKRRWPKAITPHLWPYALRTANDSYNISPSLQDPEHRTPKQLFENTIVEINPKHNKPFGCPVYVLDPQLQDGKPLHKWQERSRVGIYLGQSPIHNRSVALVLDRYTGYVSPQFHVRFDKNFHSARQIDLETKWQEATGFTAHHVKSDTEEKKRRRTESTNGNQKKPKRTLNPNESEGAESNEWQTAVESSQQPVGEAESESNDNITRAQTDLDKSKGTLDTESRVPVPAYLEGTSSRGRTPKPNSDFYYTANEALISEMIASNSDVPGELLCLEAMFPRDDTENNKDPFLAFKTSDPDTMYYHEAMKEPDRDEFIKAMEKEIDSQIGSKIYRVVPRSSVPEGVRVYKSVWALRRKRDLKTGKIKKYKARLNLDGSVMEQGVDYEQSYAGVVKWGSVRLLLALVVSLGWHTTQIDYVLAYPQAPLQRETYMEIPVGISMTREERRDHVLKVEKNIYGQKDAGRTWFKYLVNKLINEIGFKQSAIDECVFYKGNIIYVLYTDDSIIAGPCEKEIRSVIQQIKDANLDITEEGDIQDFIGVNITRKANDVIEFKQPVLIEKIIKTVFGEAKNVNTKPIPAASSKILYKHSKSEKFDGGFGYRAVIGMLNFLERATRCDISYITHQCARFASDPKDEHGQAIRWLVRYLIGTKDKGMTFVAQPDLGLEVFVDADFAGNWDKDDSLDSDTARSRHGYIIRYNGCPITWKSQLQTEIALSTTEAEYAGLSYALREAIPIMELLKEMKALGYPVTKAEADVHCQVFEDNSGAVEIAREHKYRPRTKHMNTKLHHFRSYVDSKQIFIHHIDTKEQPADILTKPVNEDILIKLRRMILGW